MTHPITCSEIHDPANRIRFAVLMAFLFGLGAFSVFLGVVNHDVAWYLHLSGRVLAGDRLSVDLIETNPPLIVWLSLVPSILARSVGFSPVLALRVLVLGLVGLSLRLIHQSLQGQPQIRRPMVLLSLLVLLLLPGYDFAQREHLTLTLFLPYLALASARMMRHRPGVGLAMVVGLMAGIGVALKPHFVLPWLAIEVYLAATEGGWKVWLRPESLALGAVGAVYALLVAWLNPEYFHLMAWAGPVYAASGHSTLIASLSEPGTVVTAVGLLGFLAMRPEGDRGKLLKVILVANLGFLAVAIIQNKGYTYHFYPAMALGLLLVGLQATGSPEASACRSGMSLILIRATLAALVLAVVVARGNESMVWQGRPGESDTPLGRMIRAARDNSDAGSVFVFSPAVAAGFPMGHYSGLSWASRHPSLWFLPAFHPQGFKLDPSNPHPSTSFMSETERFLFDSVIDDLTRMRPGLLFVDEMENPRVFLDRRFHYLDYYSLDPRFVDFLEDYEPEGKVDDFRVYRRTRRR